MAVPQIPGQEALRRRRGGGGGWRAFVANRSRGQRGRADFHALSLEYSQAREEHTPEYHDVLAQGAAATDRHRQPGVQAFGPPTREVRRRRAREVPLLEREEAANLVVEEARPSTAGEGSDAQVVWKSNLERRLAAVRRDNHRRAQLRLQRTKERQAALCEFSKEFEAESLEVVLGGVPAAMPLIDSLTIIPATGLARIEVLWDVIESACSIGGWALQHARSSNLKKTLVEHWAEVNSLVMESKTELPKIKALPPKLCQQGKCCCCGPNNSIPHLRHRLLDILKTLFDRSQPDNVAELQHGWVVLLVTAALSCFGLGGGFQVPGPAVLWEGVGALSAGCADGGGQARGGLVSRGLGPGGAGVWPWPPSC